MNWNKNWCDYIQIQSDYVSNQDWNLWQVNVIGEWVNSEFPFIIILN